MITNDWAERAKCVVDDMDPEMFDLARRGVPRSRHQEEAQLLCEGCPVMDQCAKLANRLGATGVVWAGTAIPENPYYNQDFVGYLSFVSEYNRSPENFEELAEFLSTRQMPRFTMYGIASEPGQPHTQRQPAEQRVFCKKGHALTPDNAYTPPKRPRVRECRICIRARRRVTPQ